MHKASSQSNRKLIGFDRQTRAKEMTRQYRVRQSQSAKLLEDYNVKVSLTQYGLYMLFILVVVEDSFMIHEHVVHFSTAALHSEAISFKELMRGEKVY